MPGRPLEALFGAFFRGQPFTQTSTPNNWAGKTTLNSGSTTVTVSTTLINSDSLVLLGTNPASIGSVVASYGGVAVNSIVSGVSFALSRTPAIAAPFDDKVSWFIVRTT